MSPKDITWKVLRVGTRFVLVGTGIGIAIVLTILPAGGAIFAGTFASAAYLLVLTGLLHGKYPRWTLKKYRQVNKDIKNWWHAPRPEKKQIISDLTKSAWRAMIR